MVRITDRAVLARPERNPLEISGVNKLLALAQELGVREAKDVGRSKETRRDLVEPSSERSRLRVRHEGAGLKLSLSEAATRLSEDLLGASTPPAPSSAGTTALAPQSESGPAQHALRESHGESRRSAGIAAYKRNAQANPGERIRVIA